MFKTPALIRTRIERFQQNLVRPAHYGKTAPLTISVFQCPDPVPYAQAIEQPFTTIQPGFRFGPKWSTAWFHITGTVPPEMAWQLVVLRFKSETEALVYKDGVPAQGMERNHDEYVLFPNALGNETVDLYIECGVNTFFGAGGGSRTESRAPLNSVFQSLPSALATDHGQLPGHLHTCDLATINPTVRALAWDLEFLRALENRLPEKSPRKRQILHALNAAVNAVDPANVAATAHKARDILTPLLATSTAGSSADCFATGHAHIDTAWLWPLRETVRKCARTFSTQLALMEEYPDYTFLASQAQLYAFVEQHYPKLFEKIKTKVQTGQWEPGGAMWVEADCNIPSGESLIRQILHGTNFWTDHFGPDRGKQKYLWLPDVFGYSAALPQILKQAGLDYFITQKISWSQFNKFPHHTFHWQGIDGTKLLTHFLPADSYNASNYPDELLHAQENNLDADRANLFLTAFGFGDGGGGPTRQHIEFVHRAANCDPLPKTRCSRVDNFLETLQAQSTDLQTWSGELYLELHRGTYTTQAKNKRANRDSETLLHDAEFFATITPLLTIPNSLATYPASTLDSAWKTVLLNQFHDIIPGSSITWVYEDSLEQYAQVRTTLESLITESTNTLLAQIDTSSHQNPLIIFNTLSHDDTGLISFSTADVPPGKSTFQSLRNSTGKLVSPVQEIQIPDRNGGTVRGGLARVSEIPPLGYATFDLSPDPAPLNPTESATASVESPSPDSRSPIPDTRSVAILENRLLRAEFDSAARLTRLFDKRANRELIDPKSPANQLMLYDDRPNEWNAWDVDLFYLETGKPVNFPATITLAESGPLRAAIEISRPLGAASKLTQRITLAAETLRLDFHTHVDWHENAQFLRVLHPVNIASPRATYEIQFGHAERPTHFNTSWDYARFEVCAQTWADLSEPGYGIALLNHAKYGHSCHGNVLGLSLLRAPDSPDPTADRGPQDFTYSLLPHSGDLRHRPLGSGTSVIEQAHRLNTPLRALTTTPHKGPLPARFAALSCNQPNVIIDTIKKAEKDNRLIIRLYESHGSRIPATLTINFPFKKATAVDLLENPTDLYQIRTESRTIHLDLTPFALRTIALDL